MKLIRVLASAVAALSLAGTTVVAQGAPNVRKACAADVETLCPGIADHRAARKCLRSHMADVSPSCHAAIEAARAAHAARKAEAASAVPPADAGAPPSSPPH